MYVGISVLFTKYNPFKFDKQKWKQYNVHCCVRINDESKEQREEKKEYDNINNNV